MSTATVKTENGSKVLPGDKTGLPWEVWCMIFSNLAVKDLCQCAIVCKTWNELINSLDSTKWKELYMKTTTWKHPYWPITSDVEPPSWRQAYKDQYHQSRLWSKCLRNPEMSNCLFLLKRHKERKTIHVGRGEVHESLKSALAIANDYDRIFIHSGIYDEQFEMSSKMPLELIGCGELGSVILVVCMEQVAVTGRLSNLVFRAPWFTNFILKVRRGHLQIDNCILEDGMVYVQNPATCHMKFCTFRYTTIITHHVNSSIIENCEFSQANSAAAITVEGYPKEDKNWAYRPLIERTLSICDSLDEHRKSSDDNMPSAAQLLAKIRPVRRSEHSLTGNTSFTLSNTCNAERSEATSKIVHVKSKCGNQSTGQVTQAELHSHVSDGRFPGESSNISSVDISATVNKVEPLYTEPQASVSALSVHDKRLDLLEGKEKQLPNKSNYSENVPKSPIKRMAALSGHHRDTAETSGNHSKEEASIPVQNNVAVRVDIAQVEKHSSMASESDIESDLGDADGLSDSIPTIDSFDTTDSYDSSEQSDTEDQSSSEEAVIMLSHPGKPVLPEMADADSQSISSQDKPIQINIIQDHDMRQVMEQVRGCLIRRCRISHCRGGVMVCSQAHAIVSECDISNVGYGIRCIHNSRVLVLKNEIHHCRTSGIFMRLAASGLIAGNDIHSNIEAGIDIRKNADPIVQCNRIHHGKRSGVVVLGSGRGQIKHNDIYQNREAGIYVLYRGNPVISENRIYDGKAAGIAINEGGRGDLHDNVITGNQWGGIDIRHGGDPIISHNMICNGLSDGIVIGANGRGSVENNIISGNSGCGVWIMAACQPRLHGNQIYNNGDAGVTFVNKQVEDRGENVNSSDEIDRQSQSSLRLMQILEGNIGPSRKVPACATLQYNSVCHNTGCGISVHCDEEMHIHSNTVHGNKQDGVFIDESRSLVVIENNSITSNGGNGVVSSKTGRVEIRGNGIYENKEHGIFCKNEVTIEDNDILGNSRCGLMLEDNIQVEVSKNRIQAVKDPGIFADGVEKGVIKENQLYENGEAMLEISKNNHCTVENNKSVILPSTTEDENMPPELLCDQILPLWELKDPPPRPNISSPPLLSTVYPSARITSATVVTERHGEDKKGSALCIIL